MTAFPRGRMFAAAALALAALTVWQLLTSARRANARRAPDASAAATPDRETGTAAGESDATAPFPFALADSAPASPEPDLADTLPHEPAAEGES